MATLCETYPTLDAARHAADALQAAGVPARDIGVLVHSHYHDVRAEMVGGFGGPVPPNARFGKFSGPARRRWQAAGGFWRGAAGADRRRQGSFGDADASVSFTYDRAGEHPHVSGEAMARRLLHDAHVPGGQAERMLEEMHRGHAVLFAELSDLEPRRAETLAQDIAAAS